MDTSEKIRKFKSLVIVLLLEILFKITSHERELLASPSK